MIQSEPQRRPRLARAEFLVAGFAFLALLIGEASMNATIRGTQFAAVDGRMAEAVIRAAFKLAAPFDVTNLNHIQGIGSLLLPFNVWPIRPTGRSRSSTATAPRKFPGSSPSPASSSPSMPWPARSTCLRFPARSLRNRASSCSGRW